MEPGTKVGIRWITVVLLVVLVIAEATLFVPSFKPSVSLSVEFRSSAGGVTVSSDLKSTYAGSFRQAYLWGPGPTAISTIYYYYDTQYYWANSNIVSWYGLPFHMRQVIAQRGLPIDVVVVNATRLASVLANPNPSGDLLVMGNGVFPRTVFTNTTNLVAPWLNAGGRLFWIGAPIGAYSGQPGQQETYPLQPWDPGADGVRQFLNESWTGGTGSNAPMYFDSTSMSSALNLEYPYGIGGHNAFSVSAVGAGGGEIVGPVAGGYSNAAFVPFGKGGIVDMAATLYSPGENQLGITIVNMIQVGIFSGIVQVLSLHDVNLTAGEESQWTDSLTLPPSSPSSSEQLCVFTQQTDLTAMYAAVSCLD